MEKLLLAAVSAGLLAGCAGLGGSLGFNASNLRTTADSCTVVNGKRELRLEFDYTGTLSRINLTFTPNGKPPAAVNITDLDNPPPGFGLGTRTATIARVNVDLQVIQPTPSAQAIEPPNPRTLYPMDIKVRAGDGSTEKTMELKNIDVRECYGL